MDATTKALIEAVLEFFKPDGYGWSVDPMRKIQTCADVYRAAHPPTPPAAFTPEQEARIRALESWLEIDGETWRGSVDRLDKRLRKLESRPAAPDTVAELRAACAEWAEHHGRIMLDPSPAQVRLLKALDADRAACAEEAKP